MYKFVSLLLIISCFLLCKKTNNSKRKEKTSTHRVKKVSKLISPKREKKLQNGDSITVKFSSPKGIQIDSIHLLIDEKKTTFIAKKSFRIPIHAKMLGTFRFRVITFINGKKEQHYPRLTVLANQPPEEWQYHITNIYPHNTEDYTQGLLIKDNFFYESTGKKGKSTLKKKNIQTGETINVLYVSNRYFAEGLAWIDNLFYQLTWQSEKGFIYDNNMKEVKNFSYKGEGWGLTTLGNELVMSDGTEKLKFIAPKNFTIIRDIEVYDNKGKIRGLNELEVIDGLVYANVYQKDFIIAIDPSTGEVKRKINMNGLLSEYEKKNSDVLNGIAYSEENKKIYVTGKWWAKMFEIELIKKENK